MDFEDALSILVGWLGEELQVTLRGGEGMLPILAAELFGRLRRSDELSGGFGPANSLMFILDGGDDQEVATFILAKDAFLSARWFDSTEEALEINSGVVQFLISRAED